MSVRYEDMQSMQGDSTPHKGHPGFVLNRWTSQSWSSRLICFVSALCTLLLLVIIILVVTTARRGVEQTERTMEEKLRNLSQEMRDNVEKLSQTDFRMMEKLTFVETFMKDMRGAAVITKISGMETSVKRILSDDVIGSLTSDIQRVLGAVAKLRDELKGNNTADPLCELGWKHYSYSCYYISPRVQSWEKAKMDCEKKNAHLAVITGEEEQNFLLEFTKYQTSWIGLTDVDGSWKWVDGTSYDASPKFWLDDQPDEWFGHGLGGGEDCGQLNFRGGWNDDHCSRSYMYICEKKIP